MMQRPPGGMSQLQTQANFSMPPTGTQQRPNTPGGMSQLQTQANFSMPPAGTQQLPQRPQMGSMPMAQQMSPMGQQQRGMGMMPMGSMSMPMGQQQATAGGMPTGQIPMSGVGGMMQRPSMGGMPMQPSAMGALQQSPMGGQGASPSGMPLRSPMGGTYQPPAGGPQRPSMMGAPAPTDAQQPAPDAPLLRIRAGIEKGNPQEVMAAVQFADQNGVALEPNVRTMITQWLAAQNQVVQNHAQQTTPTSSAAMPPAPSSLPSPPHPAPLPATSSREIPPSAPPPPPPAPEPAPETEPAPVTREQEAPAKNDPPPSVSADRIRKALLRIFALAPKGSDAAAGLGVIEGEEGDRFLPYLSIGRACGVEGDSDQVTDSVRRVILLAPKGTFALSDDGSGAGLKEWAGWEEFSASVDVIARAMRDPAFEPKNIQGRVLLAARGAVRAGPMRQDDVLDTMLDKLTPELAEVTDSALRNAVSRRSRLALACLVNAIARECEKAGPDALGLLGGVPKVLFGNIFGNLDSRDSGACAFMAEVLKSWERRRCFRSRVIEDVRRKFSAPSGPNSEKEEGKGWYGLLEAARVGLKGGRAAVEEAETAMMARLNASQKAPDLRAMEEAERHEEEKKREEAEEAARRLQKEKESNSPQVECSEPVHEQTGDEVAPAEPSASHTDRSEEVPQQEVSEAPAQPPGQQEQPPAQQGETKPLAGEMKAGALANKSKKRAFCANDSDEDDDAVNSKLEESRKRRAALMAKYKG